MKSEQILNWLEEEKEAPFQELLRRANQVRREIVGDQVHLRGLIEFSNVCVRQCTYCGLRAGNRNLPRYQMTLEEILLCAMKAQERGYGTVVLQSGDNYAMPPEWLADVISAIRDQTDLAIALSVGEWPEAYYHFWRECGADRVLLKWETSDQTLFRLIHPPYHTPTPGRIPLLRSLRRLGYEVGGGIMVGLPGQTHESLENDLSLFAQLNLDMIAIGPYLPHPDTPLGRSVLEGSARGIIVPNAARMTRKMLALARLLCPEANIPATAALAVESPEGYREGLLAGANVIMVNLTPPGYRRTYCIYPSRLREEEEDIHDRIMEVIHNAGRKPGNGRGDRKRNIEHKIDSTGVFDGERQPNDSMKKDAGGLKFALLGSE